MSRRTTSLALLVAAALVAGSWALTAGAARTRTSKTVASVTTSDVRLVLTAERRDDAGGAPVAVLRLAAFERRGGSWRPTAARRIAGTYFWHSVTGPNAVCRLELRTTPSPRAVVRLLQSPSLGCGPTRAYHLTG